MTIEQPDNHNIYNRAVNFTLGSAVAIIAIHGPNTAVFHSELVESIAQLGIGITGLAAGIAVIAKATRNW